MVFVIVSSLVVIQYDPLKQFQILIVLTCSTSTFMVNTPWYSGLGGEVVFTS